jgi:hypothetical protein
MANLQAITRDYVLRARTEGVAEASTAVDKLQQAHERLARTLELQTRQYEQFSKVERENSQFSQASANSLNKLAAANDNVASSLREANDSVRASSDGFHVHGLEAATLVNHLKQAAVVLYSTSSAFRGLVHASVVPALRGVSAGVAGVGAAVNVAGAGLVASGASIAALGPKFAPLAAGITSAGQAMAGFSPTLASLAVQASGLFSFLARVAFVIFAATTAFNAFISSVVDGIKAFAAFQTHQVELQNLLNATGGASGRTAKQINALADEMGDIGNSRQAAKTLLEFQNISGETFDRALRAANDLASSGFGSVQSAASAMGKALTDPQNGLDGLSKAGVRFTTSQKEMIKDLIETGRATEAYARILDIVEGKVGGASAAAANTLSSAYRELQDAVQRGNESFGETIVKATNLTTVVNLLATALNALNGEKAATALNTIFSNAVRAIPALSLLTTALTLANRMAAPAEKAVDDGSGAKRKSDASAAQIQYDAIQKVILALADEGDALRKNELQKKIDVELRKAQAVAGSAEATRIVEMVTANHKEAEAIKAADEARKKAAAQLASDEALWTRAINNVARHAATMDADALSVGKSAGVQAQLRAEFTLLERAQEAHKGVTDEQIASYTTLRATMSAQQAMVAAGIKLNDDDAASFLRVTERIRESAQAAARARVDSQIKFDRADAFLSPEDVQIAQQLKELYPQVGDALKSPEAAAMRFNNVLKSINDTAGEFTSTLAKDLAHGVNLMDALRSAAAKFGDQLIDIGTKRLTAMGLNAAASSLGIGGTDVGQAGLTGGTALAAGGAQAGAAIIAAATEAASILGLSGALTGTEVAAGGTEAGTALAIGGTVAGTAINGPLVLLMAAIVAVGAALNMWSSSSSKAKQDADALAKAQEAWTQAGLQVANYFAKSSGSAVSPIRTQLAEHAAEAQRLKELRSKAMGFTSAAQEQADPVFKEIEEAYRNFAKRLKEEFHANFGPTIEAMKSGFGEDSPIFQAFQNVKSVGEKLQAFIADAELVYGKDAPNVALARGAAQQRALSLLQGEADPLSGVQKRMQEIQGTAQGLAKVLQDLGMSSADAAKAIAEGVGKAVDALRKSFTEDLQRQINDLQGQGYLNDAFDLLKKDKERRKDDALLGGGNKDLIDQLLGLSGQDIIDKFHLTGDAFKDFIKRFPELAGRVHEFNGVIKRTADELKASRTSIQDELFGLLNDTSTVEGQIAALEREFNRRRLEEIARGGELLPDLELLYQERRKKIIEDANKKALEEAKRAAEEQQRAINSAARSVLEYIQGLQSGSGSTLSPTQTLANAQSAYNANLILAQGNPADQATRDAVSNFSKVADNLEKAARGVYASGQGYQDIRSQIIGQGLGLPTVQAADDPLLVMMRRVAEATEDTVTALTGVVKDAIAAGNASATAASLLPLFNTLNTTVDAGLTLSELQAAGLFTTAGGQAIFNKVDVDQNGMLTKAELIRAATAGTKSGVDPLDQTIIGQFSAVAAAINNVGAVAWTTQGHVGNINATTTGTYNQIIAVGNNVNAVQSAVAAVQTAVANVNAAIGTGTAGSSLQSLNTTAKDQLTLLNTHLTAGNVPGVGSTGINPDGSRGGNTSDTQPKWELGVNNILLLGINKIVYNTAAIAHNTRYTGGLDRGPNSREGLLAAGGWIGGNLHSQGGTHIEAERGEFMVNRFAADALRPYMADINRGRLPVIPAFGGAANDNGQWSAVLAELRHLRASNERLERIVAASSTNAATAIVGSVKQVTETVEKGSKNTADAISMAAREKKQRAA